MSADVLMSVYPPLEPLSLIARLPRYFPFDQPNLTLTHRGRGAVWLALRALGLGPGSRLAMPAYHCGSEVEAARLAGIDIEFYRVDPWLSVDEEDLARAAKRTDATYLISYYGFPMATPPAGTRIIEDVAHALFSNMGNVPMGSYGDAAIFCPHKTLGVPDGGALLLRGNTARAIGRPSWKPIARSIAAQGAGWAAQSRIAPLRMTAAAVVHKASKAEAAVESGILTETIIGQWDLDISDLEAAASKPSRMTEWAVRGADGDKIREKRRKNYAILLDTVPEVCPDRFHVLSPGVAPLYYPIQVSERDRTIAELQKRGVRAIEIWPVPHPMLDRQRFAELEPLRQQMLALPVHQGLSDWHMHKVANAAREAIAEAGK